MGHPFGLATYRFGKEDDTLIAEWMTDEPTSLKDKVGAGIARCRNKVDPNSFAGTYDVEYWMGGESIKLVLKIAQEGSVYKMIWEKDGKVSNSGYGFTSGDLLVAGYER